jgi:hypothetical protein
VDVDVDVHHPIARLQQLEDSKHAVRDVAKARSFRLLRVVKATRPVDRNVRPTRVQLARRRDGAACGDLTELEQTVEDRRVVADIELLADLLILSVLWRHCLQELNVVIRVEASHVSCRSPHRTQDPHLRIKTIRKNQTMRHANAVRLHWVVRCVKEVADILVVEINDPVVPQIPRISHPEFTGSVCAIQLKCHIGQAPLSQLADSHILPLESISRNKSTTVMGK